MDAIDKLIREGVRLHAEADFLRRKAEEAHGERTLHGECRAAEYLYRAGQLLRELVGVTRRIEALQKECDESGLFFLVGEGLADRGMVPPRSYVM